MVEDVLLTGSSTMYGFMSIVIGLFLANMCVIKRVGGIHLLSRRMLTYNSVKRRSVSRESTSREAGTALYEEITWWLDMRLPVINNFFQHSQAV